VWVAITSGSTWCLLGGTTRSVLLVSALKMRLRIGRLLTMWSLLQCALSVLVLCIRIVVKLSGSAGRSPSRGMMELPLGDSHQIGGVHIAVSGLVAGARSWCFSCCPVVRGSCGLEAAATVVGLASTLGGCIDGMVGVLGVRGRMGSQIGVFGRGRGGGGGSIRGIVRGGGGGIDALSLRL
jgi:hypothetical protein